MSKEIRMPNDEGSAPPFGIRALSHSLLITSFTHSSFSAAALQRHWIITVIPLVIILLSRIASQFAVRMHPWLAARPMVCGTFVP